MTVTKEMIEAAEAEFTEYFVRNYPGPDTIIMDPKWHAPKLFRAATHRLAALSSRSAEAGKPVVTANCCHCGRIIDTREISEGGDAFGAEMSDGRWTCSFECNDAVLDFTGSALSTPADIEPVAWQSKEVHWNLHSAEDHSKYEKHLADRFRPLYAAPVADSEPAAPQPNPSKVDASVITGVDDALSEVLRQGGPRKMRAIIGEALQALNFKHNWATCFATVEQWQEFPAAIRAALAAQGEKP